MIRETFYKDRPAIEISSNEFSALFLPSDGAKLVSFKHKNGNEFLAQAKGDKYRRLGLDTSYIDAECSAFDDMFPTIDPCEINGMQYLDHGEVCRHEHSVEIDGDAVTFLCKLTSLNVIYKKTAYCNGDELCVKYSIENHNSFDFPYVWAGHMMFKGESGAYAVSNFPTDSPMTVMFGNTEPGEKALHLPDVGNKQYKFYYTEAKPPIKCGVVYPKSKLQINVEFDNDIVKYFGLWVNPGDLNGMYNIALEPCTALYDNPVNAEKVGACSYIPAHKTVEFTLKMKFEEI